MYIQIPYLSKVCCTPNFFVLIVASSENSISEELSINHCSPLVEVFKIYPTREAAQSGVLRNKFYIIDLWKKKGENGVVLKNPIKSSIVVL